MRRDDLLSRFQIPNRPQDRPIVLLEENSDLISQDEYFKLISELQDFLLELHDFKKKKAHQYLFSVMQTLFLLFCSAIFYILHMKIDFIKEIVFLPLFCMCVKDGVQKVKTIQMNAKFFKQFKLYISKFSYPY